MKPHAIAGTTPFKSRENSLFYIKKALQNGHVRSSLIRTGVQTPRTPRIIRLIIVTIIVVAFIIVSAHVFYKKRVCKEHEAETRQS